MNRPQLSVVVANYNNAKYLSECIDSILSNDLTNFELIIVDDCSTDNSVEIIESYNDPRIKLIVNQVNSKVSFTRNAGINAASADYITFIDSDDTVSKNYFSSSIDILEKYNLDSVICHTVVVNENQDIQSDLYYIDFNILPTAPIYLSSINLALIPVNAPGKFFRLSCLKDNNLYFKVGRNYEDFDFSLRFYTKFGNSFSNHDTSYIYRVHNSSFIQLAKHGKKRIEDLYELTAEFYDYLKEHNVFDHFKTLYLYYVFRNYHVYSLEQDLAPRVKAAMIKLFARTNYPTDYIGDPYSDELETIYQTIHA